VTRASTAERKMTREDHLPAGAALVGTYDSTLVLLSIVAAIAGSFAALELASGFTAATGRPRQWWLVTAAVAQGIGIWAMHYTGMLAFRLPLPARYHWPTALLSFVIAIAGAAVAVFVVSRPLLPWRGAIIGSLFMGAAIVGQHYTAMASMRVAATCRYSTPLVVLSAIVAVAFSLLSLRVTFSLRRSVPHWRLRRLGGALQMGAAISLMHYIAMAAATFTASDAQPDWSHAVVVSTLGAVAIALVTTALVAVAIVSSTLDRRTRAIRDLRAFSEGLRAAREADAKRIARELHDEVGPLLTSVKWELERLEKHCDASGGPAFDAMGRRIDETLDRVRRLASELRSPVLDDLGLAASIEHEARQFELRTGIATRADVLIEDDDEPDAAAATALYRILQEALTNVGRHARATRVNVVLEERSRQLTLEVRDNGIGIPTDALHAASALGIVGMRERTELIGARIEIAATPGRGTVVAVSLPLRRRLRTGS
jgi:signal transduction histidine kinase